MAVALLAPTAVMVASGCGDSAEFSREFEKPETTAPPVTDPPDTGEDLSPRDRRRQ